MLTQVDVSRKARLALILRARSNPRPGRQVISGKGAKYYFPLTIGMDIPKGWRRLTEDQLAAVEALPEPARQRYGAARLSGRTHAGAMADVGVRPRARMTKAEKIAAAVIRREDGSTTSAILEDLRPSGRTGDVPDKAPARVGMERGARVSVGGGRLGTIVKVHDPGNKALRPHVVRVEYDNGEQADVLVGNLRLTGERAESVPRTRASSAPAKAAKKAPARKATPRPAAIVSPDEVERLRAWVAVLPDDRHRKTVSDSTGSRRVVDVSRDSPRALGERVLKAAESGDRSGFREASSGLTRELAARVTDHENYDLERYDRLQGQWTGTAMDLDERFGDRQLADLPMESLAGLLASFGLPAPRRTETRQQVLARYLAARRKARAGETADIESSARARSVLRPPAAKEATPARSPALDRLKDAPEPVRELARRPMADVRKVARYFAVDTAHMSVLRDPAALTESIYASRLRAWRDPDRSSQWSAEHAAEEMRRVLVDVDAAKPAKKATPATPKKASPQSAVELDKVAAKTKAAKPTTVGMPPQGRAAPPAIEPDDGWAVADRWIGAAEADERESNLRAGWDTPEQAAATRERLSRERAAATSEAKRREAEQALRDFDRHQVQLRRQAEHAAEEEQRHRERAERMRRIRDRLRALGWIPIATSGSNGGTVEFRSPDGRRTVGVPFGGDISEKGAADLLRIIDAPPTRKDARQPSIPGLRAPRPPRAPAEPTLTSNADFEPWSPGSQVTYEGREYFVWSLGPRSGSVWLVPVDRQPGDEAATLALVPGRRRMGGYTSRSDLHLHQGMLNDYIARSRGKSSVPVPSVIARSFIRTPDAQLVWAAIQYVNRTYGATA